MDITSWPENEAAGWYDILRKLRIKLTAGPCKMILEAAQQRSSQTADKDESTEQPPFGAMSATLVTNDVMITSVDVKSTYSAPCNTAS